MERDERDQVTKLVHWINEAPEEQRQARWDHVREAVDIAQRLAEAAKARTIKKGKE